EAGGAYMADGYARVSGGLGVCCGTAGPGTTNLLTGVAVSFKDSIPLLVLTAQVPLNVFGKGATQESSAEDRSFSSAELLKPITKYSAMILTPEHLPFFARKAIRNALRHRMGPTHLNLPPDIMRKPSLSDNTMLEAFEDDACYFDRAKVKMAAQAILAAKDPVIFAGFGVILSNASQKLLELAELLCIPVASTPKGKGCFPENHPLALGVMGLAGSEAAEEKILGRENSDLMISIGMSFDEWSTNSWDRRVKGTKKLIHLDIDPQQIGKNYSANIALIGDARTVLSELLYEIRRQSEQIGFTPARTIEPSPALYGKLLTESERQQVLSNSIPIKPQRLIHELRKSLPDETIFFIDAGNHTLWALHYLQINKPGTFVIAAGFGPMGYSIPAAVGGKLAAGERPVVALCGDGCFLMHGMEVATAVKYKIPVIWVVFNDGRLNMVYQAEELQKKGGLDSYDFPRVDIAGLAVSLGAIGERVEDPDQISAVIKKCLKANQPSVIDVIIDPEEVSPLKKRIESIIKNMKA
ncbi:MAG: thiamine pyrophosphate-binding protein, partial [Candidatus Riflebacteria bacterium]